MTKYSKSIFKTHTAKHIDPLRILKEKHKIDKASEEAASLIAVVLMSANKLNPAQLEQLKQAKELLS